MDNNSTPISQNSMPNYMIGQNQSGMGADSIDHKENVSKYDDDFSHHLNVQHMPTARVKKIKSKVKNNSIILPFSVAKHEGRHSLSSQQYRYMIELERMKLESLNKLICSFVENSFSVLKDSMVVEVQL